MFRGTPPPKPLNCKIVSARVIAPAGHTTPVERNGVPALQFVWHCQTSSRRRLVIVHRSSPFVAAISPSVSGNKKPCLRCGKQGEREIRLSFFRTCLHRDYPNYLRAVAQWVRGIASGETHNPGYTGYDVSRNFSGLASSANSWLVC